MNLPRDYRVVRDADTLILVAPNGKDVAYFTPAASPAEVSRVAWSYEAKTDARIAYLGELLERKARRRA